MKHTVLAGLVVLMTALGAPIASAKDNSSTAIQNGVGNRVDVQQGSAKNSRVFVEQIGSQIYTAVEQSGRNNAITLIADGSNQDHRIRQQGRAPNELDILSVGAWNSTDVHQRGGGAGGNTASIHQDGTSNRAVLFQRAQSGGGNVVGLLQDGNDNHGDIHQRGSNNEAALNQVGDGNSAVITQNGHGLAIGVDQTGGAAIVINQR